MCGAIKNLLLQSSLPRHDMNLHYTKHYRNILANNNFLHSTSLSAMPVPGLGGINANVFPFSSVFDKMQQFFCIKLCICF